MRLLFAALAMMTLTSTATAATSPGRLEFEVTRNGEPFGRHTVEVRRSGEGLEVRNAVALRAGVGPVTVFRYEQSCVETWRSGALQGLQCSTLKDGRRLQVSIERQGDGLVARGAGGERAFESDALPTSWWTRSALSGATLIDTETGREMPVRIRALGADAVQVNGQAVPANRFRVEGTLAMDIWYDRAGRWVRTAFTARGQRIEYNLVSPLSAAPL